MPHFHRHCPLLAIVTLVAMLLTACGERIDLLDGIRAGGVLRIATIAGSTTVRRGGGGLSGFEHDLASAYADWLGVTPRFILARDYQELRELVTSGRAHIGAALLPLQPDDDTAFEYGPSYAVGRQWVIHRRDQPQPQTPTDLMGWRGATIDGRGATDLLEASLPHAAGYTWSTHSSLAIAELLRRVDRGDLDYAVLPSFEFEARRRYFPDLRAGFEIGVPQPVAWLNRTTAGHILATTQLEFLRFARESGELDAIVERYFGHVDDFDYVESREFLRDYNERLPRFRDDFQTIAATNNLDWRLLAAISYQESRWREDAKSPTGVKGLMMLTRSTARFLKVNRLDPTESIDGGARYLKRMKNRLPKRIQEPDRTFLALAAYNIGFGHLEDARVFTDRAGLDADEWASVQDFLPRLSNPKWASKARYGRARGYQAVHFVTKVQQYYAMLRWLERDRLTADSELLEPPQALITPVL